MDTRKARLHDKFGTIPEGREWKKTVETFYDLYRSGENESADGIDDITWQNAVKLLELTGFPEKIIRAALR